MDNINQNTVINLYKNIFYIRRVEEILSDEYRKGVMKTPTHFGIGQEAIATGVCAALNGDDVIYTHHRSHTHYLGKGGSLFGLMAELLGRDGGCSKGRGGSVHLVDRSVGFLGSSPILGHSLALASGSGLAFKMDHTSKVAVAFFGEGACDEGAAWECFNYASVNKLPVLFVCENNLYATESPMAVRQHSEADLCKRLESFQVKAKKIDGNDVFDVYHAAINALNYCRNGHGPMFLECMTYRWREHVGPMWDYEINRTYRTKEELDEWLKKCPVIRARKYLIDKGIATIQDIDNWNNQIEQEISLTLEKAYESPWPDPKTLFENV